jgi:hypothetical protein
MRSTTGVRRVAGRIPPPHLHQVGIGKRHAGGVGVDINNICKPQFGQWVRALLAGKFSSKLPAIGRLPDFSTVAPRRLVGHAPRGRR